MVVSSGIAEVIDYGTVRTVNYLNTKPELKIKDSEFIKSIAYGNDFLNYKSRIDKIWSENLTVINEFEKLDKFNVITSFKHNLSAKSHAYLSLDLSQDIYRLYRAKILLDAEEGDFASAVDRLVKIHSIALKGLRGPNDHTTFMVWLAVSTFDTYTGLKLVNMEHFPRELIPRLLTTFTEVKPEDFIENSVKIEYLYLKKRYENGHSIFHSADNKLARLLLFRPNRTFSELHKYFQMAIDESRKVYFAEPEYWSVMEKELSQLDSTNIEGWMLLNSLPVFNGLTIWLVKVRNEILRLKLTEMIGGDTSQFIDPYTDKPFVKNKGGEYYSPGPDRKFDTEDDITL